MTSYKKYVGQYLSVADVEKELSVIIFKFQEEEVGQEEDKKEKKLVAYFEGLDKGLALNTTNLDKLAEISGTDQFEEWIGLKIVLFNDTSVRFQGKKGGIRIKVAPTTKA